MSNWIASWRGLALDKFPLKLEADSIQQLQYFEYKSYAEFISSKDFGKSESAFHLALIPQPYIGNLAKAKVFLFMLNPGFSAGDYYAQESSLDFREARINNLKQKNENDEYPFFYLNPQFAWTAGGKWWQDKLSAVARKLANHEKFKGQATAYQQTLSHISKNLACIELCPYFSKLYKEPRPRLPSMVLAHEYVANELEKRCQRGEVSAVLLRQIGIWGLSESESVFRLDPKQARGAHLTVGSEAELTSLGYIKKAGDFVYDKLVALLEEPKSLR